MSGVATTPQQYLEGNHRCLMQKFAKKYNKWVGDDLDGLIELLKTAPEHEILDFASEIEAYPRYKLEFEIIATPNKMWYPIIESEDAIRPFLLENPVTKFENIESFNITTYFTHTNRVSRLEILN